MRVNWAQAIALLAALTSATAASATSWAKVTVSDNGTVWYVDVESIKTISDGYGISARKAWIKLDYTNTPSTRSREAKVLIFIRCNEEQAKVVSWTEYAPDGSTRDATTAYPIYKPVIPDSVLSSAMQAVCGVSPPQ